jgi:K(+)-stimulated pyrophosphate-energized sodium pump
MAADLFETYAVTLVAVMFLGAVRFPDTEIVYYPLVIGGVAILASVVGTFFARVGPGGSIMAALYKAVAVSTVLSALLFIPVTASFDSDRFPFWNLYGCTLVGLGVTFLLVAITEYYTGTRWAPVKGISRASLTGHATNIIEGLAIGMQATAAPVLVIATAIVTAYEIEGLFGVGVAVMAQLAMTGLIVALDAYGPVTDNAGGIAEMAELDESVRAVTDPLDAVGNTTKAVTKGYAIGSAGLAALILFDGFTTQLDQEGLNVTFMLNDAWVIAGLFIGGLMPFLFSSLAMQAVGRVGGQVVQEVRRQFREIPGILEGTGRPEYGRTVNIVTGAAIKNMMIPSLIPVLFPIIVGIIKP